MFQQDRDETANRPKHSVVNHDWNGTTSVRPHIGCIKAAWENAVELYGSALPGSAQSVAERKIQFRTVEGTFPRLNIKHYATHSCSISECLLGPIPEGIRARANLRPGGQGYLGL